MGLLAEFTMDDLGYPLETDILNFPVDYSLGCSVFVDTFLEVASNRVPVDTGHLRHSLEGSSGDDWCTCVTYCDYAQYVEYGTYKMDAQPYFEPAIASARKAATPLWKQALAEAKEEEREELREQKQRELEEEQAAAAERDGPVKLNAYDADGNRMPEYDRTAMKSELPGGMGMGASIGGAIIAALITALLQALFGSLFSRSDEDTGKRDKIPIEIEII